jgi:hypothetical protein
VYNNITNPEDEAQLQLDLDNLVEWATTWGMRFNAAKCNIMRVTSRRNLDTPNYTMMGTRLDVKQDCQYLGIHIQDNLKWNKQSQHAANKGSRTLGFIQRNFYHTSTNIKEKLYQTLVRPHLEYGVAAWDPYTAKNINLLERIQRRAARYVTNNYSREASVSEMMTTLGWYNLQDRRTAHRLTCLYKITNDQVDISKDYIKPKTDRARRGHNQQLRLYTTNLAPFANSFFPRTITQWNNLPQSTISQPSKDSFCQSILPSP